jgi:uncharacterized protein YoxC
VNSEELRVINQKTLTMILATLCIASITITSGLAAYHASIVNEKNRQITDLYAEITTLNEELTDLSTIATTLNNTINQKNNLIAQKNDEITSLNNQITNLNSQIVELEAELGQPASQPMLVIDEANVEDLRFGSPYALYINCRVNNTGGGVAYNAFLHVYAFNAEGVAIDSYHSFGGVTAGRAVGLDFSVEYIGSPIESWQIRPIWTNQFVIPKSGTFPP